jgi:hypothetical protein
MRNDIMSTSDGVRGIKASANLAAGSISQADSYTLFSVELREGLRGTL